MKKEITPDVYSSTLEFLEDRAKIYSIFLSSAESEESIARYTAIRDDCEEILAFFKNTYTPRKRRRAKRAKGETGCMTMTKETSNT